MKLSDDVIRAAVTAALREDIGHGDITTQTLIPPGSRAVAQLILKEDGIIAGLPLVEAVFRAVNPDLQTTLHVTDGTALEAGTVLAAISGDAQSILTGERVALNYLQRLSGIATVTARYVTAVGDEKARILDTRKTTPGLRALEKYAVRMGGGVNHRFGLYDAIMVKDNHLALLAGQGVPLAEVVRRARAAAGPFGRVEIEVETVAQADEAASAGADLILLDNMPPAQMREAVNVVAGRAQLEASGGITLRTIKDVAASGVDFISVGALTHSATALDISLDLQPL